jgi:predicted porin
LWGLRISEDLGGGIRALVHLESAFSSRDGRLGDALFSRYSVVGLSSSLYGTLWFGRAMALPDSDVWAIDPMGLQVTGAPTLQRNRSWGPREKVFTYESSQIGAWSFRAQARPSDRAAGGTSGRLLAAGVTYRSEALLAKGIYEEIRDGAGRFSSLYGASRLVGVGAVYGMGRMKTFAGYNQIRSGKNTAADADNPAGASEQRTYWLGANYGLTNALTLQGGAYRALVNREGAGATLLAAGVIYQFSKNTLLYGTLGNLGNGRNATISVEDNGLTPSAGTSQRNAYAGIVQQF